MKTTTLLAALAIAASSAVGFAADSKRTADYILTSPSDFEGKEVTLDVAFVKPVRWKSPVPELAFFHAMTTDRRDDRPAGRILVVVAADKTTAFARKYGTDPDGRRLDADTLRGILLAAPGKHPRARVWMVDTDGRAAELIKNKKLMIDDEGVEGDELDGQGPGAGNGPQNPPQPPPGGPNR